MGFQHSGLSAASLRQLVGAHAATIGVTEAKSHTMAGGCVVLQVLPPTWEITGMMAPLLMAKVKNFLCCPARLFKAMATAVAAGSQ